jgi:hypothetical protein
MREQDIRQQAKQARRVQNEQEMENSRRDSYAILWQGDARKPYRHKWGSGCIATIQQDTTRAHLLDNPQTSGVAAWAMGARKPISHDKDRGWIRTFYNQQHPIFLDVQNLSKRVSRIHSEVLHRLINYRNYLKTRSPK